MASLSDTGNAREVNQDYFGYCEPASDEAFFRLGRLAVVADGMGGHSGGEIASRLAVHMLCDSYFQSRDSDSHAALIAGFSLANRSILDLARAEQKLTGMGTTCTVLALLKGSANFAHVGDTRLYLVRGADILQLTHDHSLVADLVHRGRLRAEEAENHPDRHVLLSALGSESVEVEINPYPITLIAGDLFVLCSDGLSSLVRNTEIMRLCRELSVSEAAARLIALAKERGGHDNITVQIIKIVRD